MMDMLALTNSSLNFILYCLMSSQFRNTLQTIFWKHKAEKLEVIRCLMLQSFYNVDKMSLSWKQIMLLRYHATRDLFIIVLLLHLSRMNYFRKFYYIKIYDLLKKRTTKLCLSL